jgi:hypothetical protein
MFCSLFLLLAIFREMMGIGAGWMEHLGILPSGHLESLILPIIVFLAVLVVGTLPTVETGNLYKSSTTVW